LLNGTPKIEGTGQTIAIVGESNINLADVSDFRTAFNLPQNFLASNIILNGLDPGINPSEGESDLDVHWAGAAAPGATMDLTAKPDRQLALALHYFLMLATTILDTNWMGRPRSIAAALLESDGHRAMIDPGPASVLPTLRQQLDSRGIEVSDLNAILLTHIHLDHAGATGALIKENPNLEVYVHKAGMLHMANPSKLLASAERLWPGELGHLFGETLPVPFGNLRMLEGGETLALGSRNVEVVYTPGHASHHVSYFDSSDGTAFVGDTTGFHIEGEPFVVPLAPPPDIDLEIWYGSLEAIAARHPARLFLTHFGYSTDPAAHIAEYRENMRHWAALAAKTLRSTPDERGGNAAFVSAASSEIEKHVTGAEAEHYVFNCGLHLTWLGLARYHRKRAEAAVTSGTKADAPSIAN
jgi:glyoxylase-like metal-dependent hydrolase (beta-lactamase superfamily II)